jgi:hypothetical protein
MPWYESPQLWVSVAAGCVAVIFASGVWLGAVLGFERGERRAAAQWAGQVADLERAAYRPRELTRVRVATYSAGYPAPAEAPTMPLTAIRTADADTWAGEWTYPGSPP